MNIKLLVCSLGAVAMLLAAGCAGPTSHNEVGMGGTGAAYQGSSEMTGHGDSTESQLSDYRDTLSNPGPF
jgi:hypothetical protein